MENKIITKKLLDFSAPKNQLYKLSYNTKCFVPMNNTIFEDEVLMDFNLTDLTSAAEIYSLSYGEQLRFLINVYSLTELSTEYTFSLDTSNLYYSLNLTPNIFERDVNDQAQSSTFLSKYKALVANILNPKYKYAEYLRSGEGLYSKKAATKALLPIASEEELLTHLATEYKKEIARVANTQIMVNKKANKVRQVLFPICIIIMILCIVLAGYLYFIRLPHKDALINANEQFLEEDYNQGIDILNDIPVSEIPKYVKYQLARAYIISESLSYEQKENILNSISTKSTDSALDYWIYIGRLEFDNSIDTAQRIGDEDILLYALMKYKVDVQSDSNISGAEKTDKLDSLSSQINAIVKGKSDKENELFEAEAEKEELKKQAGIAAEAEESSEPITTEDDNQIDISDLILSEN